jgi:hypothetical protein
MTPSGTDMPTKGGSMEFEDFRQRVQAERKVRAQRDAAEKDMPGERLRREIREAFERENADARGEVRPIDETRDSPPLDDPQR